MSRMCAFACSPLVFVALAGVFVSGCGPSDKVVPGSNAISEDTQRNAADLKQLLQFIAESGEAGSALEGMKESITKLDMAEDTKQHLLGLYEKLARARQPAEIKKVAAEMAQMLP